MGDRMAHREQAMQSNGCDESRARWDRSPRLASNGWGKDGCKAHQLDHILETNPEMRGICGYWISTSRCGLERSTSLTRNVTFCIVGAPQHGVGEPFNQKRFVLSLDS